MMQEKSSSIVKWKLENIGKGEIPSEKESSNKYIESIWETPGNFVQ